MDRNAIITELQRRARLAESAMLRVLSRDELAWLIEPLLPTEPGSAANEHLLSALRTTVDLREPARTTGGSEAPRTR